MKRKLFANLGDVNWLEHGGFLVFNHETNGPEIDIVELHPDSMKRSLDDPKIQWTVFTVPVEKNVLGEWFFSSAYLSSVAIFSDREESDLIWALLSDDNLMEKAMAYQDVISYFGAYEFDQYPLILNSKEMLNRYPELIDKEEFK